MLNEMKDRAANLYNQRFAYDIVYNTFVSKLERIVHEE
jgi:hypothetical protein